MLGKARHARNKAKGKYYRGKKAVMNKYQEYKANRAAQANVPADEPVQAPAPLPDPSSLMDDLDAAANAPTM